MTAILIEPRTRFPAIPTRWIEADPRRVSVEATRTATEAEAWRRHLERTPPLVPEAPSARAELTRAQWATMRDKMMAAINRHAAERAATA
jgi:hypothetical protein